MKSASLPDEPDPDKKAYLQKKLGEYMSRAEQIKESIKDKQSRGQIVDKIHILANGSGYSYNTLFGKYLDDNVKEISLEEPYLRDFYQVRETCFSFRLNLIDSLNQIIFVFK